jgi:hypothetical protein
MRRPCCGTPPRRPAAPPRWERTGEAAAQFERALRFADGLDKPALAALQKAVAGEYSLLDRWERRSVRCVPPSRCGVS